MVYRPGEDSFLLKEWLEEQKLQDKKVLDMGTGSGILAVTAARKGAEVVAADIDPGALEYATGRANDEEVDGRIEFVESDLFDGISYRDFDLVVFNPPYLPGDIEDSRWNGGENGVEVSERFLEAVDSYLAEGGEAVIMASSLGDHERLREKFGLEVVEFRKFWFEKLFLMRYK